MRLLAGGKERKGERIIRMSVEYRCCETEFFINILIIVLLVLFAGMMSGLTLGLMSMSLVDLEVLAQSGTPKDKKHAGNSLIPCFYVLVCNRILSLIQFLSQLVCNPFFLKKMPGNMEFGYYFRCLR